MTSKGLSRVGRALEPLAIRGLRTGLSARARDGARLLNGRALVLAPHPDDETLGCGGLICLKARRGQPVDVAVVSDGAASGAGTRLGRAGLADLRRRETLAACAELGIGPERVAFLDLPDGRLAAARAEMEAAIADLAARLAPEAVFVCAGIDGHDDHRALARAVGRLAARGALGDAAVYQYPVWAWDFRSWRGPGRSGTGFARGLGRMARVIRRSRVLSLDAREAMVRKRAALAHHRSQLGALADDPDWPGLPDPFLAHFLTGRELYFAAPHPAA